MKNIVTWDEKSFLRDYDRVKTQYYDLKKLRASVFQNTVDIVKQGFYFNENEEEVKIEDPLEAKPYKFQPRFTYPKTAEQQTEINVENEDCMIVGINLKRKGLNPVILNMANAFNAGGGVTRGSMAQEEEIFRRTNLFKSLFPLHKTLGEEYGFKPIMERLGYPMTKYGAIYSPNITIFREDKKNGYKLMKEPVKMDFISAAAFKNPPLLNDTTLDPRIVPDMMQKIITILRVALENNHDSFVLGAWGCGAFKNPPRHIAKLFHKVLEQDEFKTRFKNITFAIIEDYNSLKDGRKGNLKPFQDEFLNIDNKIK